MAWPLTAAGSCAIGSNSNTDTSPSRRCRPTRRRSSNPVEAIWAYLKKHEIANLCLNTIAEVSDFARRRLKSMQRRPRSSSRRFWKAGQLEL